MPNQPKKDAKRRVFWFQTQDQRNLAIIRAAFGHVSDAQSVRYALQMVAAQGRQMLQARKEEIPDAK